MNSERRIRLVKGSHIILKRWWDGDHGFALQAPDKRLIFVNPYFEDLALVGTTDIPFEGRAEDVAIDEDETDYLLGILNRYFKTELAPSDVLTSYSGVRPLFDDDSEKGASAVTRDYEFELDGGARPGTDSVRLWGQADHLSQAGRARVGAATPFLPQHETRTGPPARRAAGWRGTGRGLTRPGLSAFQATGMTGCQPTWRITMAAATGQRRTGMLDGDRLHCPRWAGTSAGCSTNMRQRWLMREEWAKSAADILDRRTKAWRCSWPQPEIEGVFKAWCA